MKPTQNPFSLYDFLGYLVPGLLFITGIIVVVTPLDAASDPLHRFSLIFEGINAEAYLPALLLCYFLGHLLSYSSSMTIEKYSIWTVGYPSRYLLSHDEPVYLSPQPVSSRLVLTLDRLVRVILWVVLLPVTLLDLVLGRLLGFRSTIRKVLDDHLKAQIEEHMSQMFASRSQEESHDFFRIIYHYTYERCNNHSQKMQNYVALYGFTRTMCFVIVALFWILIVHAFFNHALNWSVVVPEAVLAIVSYLLYADFNKFYRKFSLEVFMALCAINLADQSSGSPTQNGT